MVTGIVDLARHGPNSTRHNGNQSGGLSGAVLEKLDDIRRGLAAVDPRCTGLVSEKDFKKVLYLEGGISYSEINLIIEEAPRKGGFVGYDAWIVDYLNLYQPADSSFRTQRQPTAHPGQPWEEIQRVVIEGATHLLSSLTLLDVYSTGYCSVADMRGALYLKIGLKPEQVDMMFQGVTEGDVNYADWISFFTANPTPTVDDLGQFIRYGGASTSGTCHPDLGEANPQLLATREGKMMLPDLRGAPGVPYTDCKSEVCDYHVMATQDIREKYRLKEFEYQNDRRDQALKEKSAMTLASEYGVQHTKTL
jgi:hypothetical protein